MFTPLSQDRFEKIMKSAGKHLIFKHSTTCGVSSTAYDVVSEWIKGYHEPKYLLDVHTTP